MARRRDELGRQPQFTESQYEIPSWQTPWSKPWYQRTDNSSSDKEKPRTYKYNSRGHLVDCNCSLCEEDLEKAFSPQSNTNPKTLFDIPKDRRKEIKIEEVEDDENGAGKRTSTSTRPQNSSSSSFSFSGSNPDAPKRVYMFSELAEVSPPTTGDARNSEPRSSNASVSGQRDRENASSSHQPSNNGTRGTHNDIMEGFGQLTAIQAISDRNNDIQERVRNFRGTSRTPDYRAMTGLLESLLRELQRINSSVEWVATTKAIAVEAIQKSLQTLEKKVQDDES